MTVSAWQLEMGANVGADGRVHFRVWAPEAHSVEVEAYPPGEGIVRCPMKRHADGVWSASLELAAGALYRYRLNDEWSYPDPYSRSQPEGVHGPSQVVNPAAFSWTDAGWTGPDPETLVIYECHVGAYTEEGTFDALIAELDELASLGVTALELMPVAEFPGKRNWGYDGVDLFAPARVYGGPDALRRLVDAAHARGLGIILDVVYNHLGPDGNYLGAYSPYYFTDSYQTPWGDALNFDGEHSGWVRRFFIDNALHWLHEYHVDGFRLDATHRIYDEGPKHLLQELSEAVHERGIKGRRSFIFAEDERNDLRMVLPPDAGGYGLDGLWVDDFHHSVHVLLTEEERGYLKAFEGTTEEVARLLRVGFLYQRPPEEPGETPAGVAPPIPARQLIYALQNHDQVGNRPAGHRLAHLVDTESLKAAVSLLLLTPCTPMVLMGSEFASSRPFYFFTDFEGELGEQVTQSRFDEFEGFWASRDAKRFTMPDPQDEETFLQSKLDLTERRKPAHSAIYALYRNLLQLRREDPVLNVQDRWRLLADAPEPGLVAMERWNDEGERRLVLVNFGHAVSFQVDHQAWMGEAAELSWHLVLSTAEERFAGPGGGAGALRPGESIDLAPRSASLWAADGA